MNKFDLGNLVYKGNFDFVVNLKNDGNGHLGNDKYFYLCENIRKNFLRSFCWSDKKFTDEGNSQRRREYLIAKYFKSIKKGETINSILEIYSGNGLFFYMNFKFFNKKGEFVFEALTKDFFVNKEEKPIKTPEFFYDKIRNI